MRREHKKGFVNGTTEWKGRRHTKTGKQLKRQKDKQTQRQEREGEIFRNSEGKNEIDREKR